MIAFRNGFKISGKTCVYVYTCDWIVKGGKLDEGMPDITRTVCSDSCLDLPLNRCRFSKCCIEEKHFESIVLLWCEIEKVT